MIPRLLGWWTVMTAVKVYGRIQIICRNGPEEEFNQSKCEVLHFGRSKIYN